MGAISGSFSDDDFTQNSSSARATPNGARLQLSVASGSGISSAAM